MLNDQTGRYIPTPDCYPEWFFRGMDLEPAAQYLLYFFFADLERDDTIWFEHGSWDHCFLPRMLIRNMGR